MPFLCYRCHKWIYNCSPETHNISCRRYINTDRRNTNNSFYNNNIYNGNNHGSNNRYQVDNRNNNYGSYRSRYNRNRNRNRNNNICRNNYNNFNYFYNRNRRRNNYYRYQNRNHIIQNNNSRNNFPHSTNRESNNNRNNNFSNETDRNNIINIGNQISNISRILESINNDILDLDFIFDLQRSAQESNEEHNNRNISEDKNNDNENNNNNSNNLNYYGDEEEEAEEENEDENEEEEEDEELYLEDIYEVRNPIDQEVLDQFPITKIDDVSKLKENKCIICYEEFINGDEKMTVPCFHIFHPKCIDKWFKNHNSCPICKTEFTDVNIE